MFQLFEMRAYGKVCGDETSFDRVGFIILDEDDDPPVMNIYDDERIPSCGSNWSLCPINVSHDEQEVINRLLVQDYERNKYYHDDWMDLI